MASAVDICNLALSHLGDEATVTSISPPEGSAQAEHCAMFYPIARDEMLANDYEWNFATKRVSLASVSNPSTTYAFAYAKPSDCIRARAVLLPESTDDKATQDFVVETDTAGNEIILTNTETATLRYSFRVTNTAKFGPAFVTALSYLLASYLAGPVVKGKAAATIARGHLQMYGARLALAKAEDANARKTSSYSSHRPAWISARS